MNDHIDDQAELYALGALDEIERTRIERHVSACASCARRLGEAEATVTVLAAAEPSHVPAEGLSRRMRGALPPQPRKMQRGFHWQSGLVAVAALLVLTLIPVWVAVDRTRGRLAEMRQDEVALARIASSPFDRAGFAMRSEGGAMGARVLYGADGSWYYVVVMHPKPNMQVAYVHGGRMEMLGTVALHGESGSLYLPIKHKMEELALLDAGRVVGYAHLVY